jgi:hypothetical protein
MQVVAVVAIKVVALAALVAQEVEVHHLLMELWEVLEPQILALAVERQVKTSLLMAALVVLE